jgi:hypothetical protein
MMKKIYILVLLLLFCLQNKAFSYDCRLDSIQIGNNFNELQLEKGLLIVGGNPDEASSMFFPIEYFCKDSDETNGVMLNLLFLENKLVRIIFENEIIQNKILFRIANNTYKVGFVKNEAKINKKETESYKVNKNDNLYYYANFIEKDNFFEYFEITGNKYKDKLNKHLLKEEGQ